MSDHVIRVTGTTLDRILADLDALTAGPVGDHLGRGEGPRYLAGTMPAADARRIEAHLDSCPVCARAVEAILDRMRVLAPNIGLAGKVAAFTASPRKGTSEEGLGWHLVEQPDGALQLVLGSRRVEFEGRRLRLQAGDWSEEVELVLKPRDQVGAKVVLPAEVRRRMPEGTELLYGWLS